MSETQNNRLYCDYNATGIPKPEVITAVADAMAHVGNPSSVHADGRAARLAVDEARDAIAALIGAPASGIIFTGCGTEATNMALRGTGARSIIHSAIEHEATFEAAKATGLPVHVVPVDADGVIDMAAYQSALDEAEAPALISVMLANNETGVVQPVAKIAALAHDRGALVHTDAIQCPSKIPVDFGDLDVDMMSIAAHKMGGPQGIGALVTKPGIDLDPFLVGGGQERGRRSGTENVAGIVGFGAAAKAAARDLPLYDEVRNLRDQMETEISATAPKAVVFGARVDRLPNTSYLSMPGVAGDTQVMQFDLAGISLSSGSACSSGTVRESHVMKAMQAGEAGLQAVRVSMGPQTSADDVARFIAAWKKIYARQSEKKQGGAA